MKSVLIYDSVFGNTEKVAEIIAEITKSDLVHASNYKTIDFNNVDLLIVGSPTHGGRATDEMQKVLNSFKDLKDVKIAAFDTRSAMKWVKIFGFAADRMNDRLKSLNATIIIEPTGFCVSKKEGPLIDHEIERAKDWAMSLVS